MAANSSNHAHLIRGLGLIAASSVIIGNVIGTGVFLKARVMTCNVGSPWWMIAAWIAAGLLSLAGALTYAELTAMKPEAGGQYVFLRQAYGKAAGFLFGWMQMLIARPGSQAAAGVAFAIGLNDFLGKSLERTLFETSLAGNKFSVTLIQLVAVLMIVVFTALNCASIKSTGYIATFLTFVKIALIIFVGFGAFILVTGDFSHFSLINSGGTCEGVNDSVRYGSVAYTFIGGFGAAMLGALWGYDGWDNLTFVAGEVKEPSRNIPLAIIGSTILIILLYGFVQVGYYYVLSPTEIASVSASSSVAKVVVSGFFGAGTILAGISVTIFTTGLMLSSLGTMHTSMMSGGRIPYAMAKDGQLPHALGKLSSTHVPVNALLLQGVFACILALSGSFDTLTDYVIFGSWIFYALVTSSIFVFRRKYPDLERPYKAFGYPVVPVVFLLVALWLLINTLMTATLQSGIGLFLIALGLPFYYYFNRRNDAGPTDPEPEN